MGFVNSTVKFFFHRIIETTVVFILVVYIPGLPPNNDISKPYKVTPPRPFEGPLALNDKLNSSEILFEGELLGPESFAELNGEIYTGIRSGDIVKIRGKHITPIARIGKPCKGLHYEHICGRPLGLRFHHATNDLYVADSYYGIYKVDVKTGDVTPITSIDEEIGGQKSKLPNSLAIACNGDIFWSDSSTQFSIQDGLFDLLSDGSGRLIHYDAKTKKSRVLIDNIVFSNGVVLSESEDYVLVAETAKNQILRYWLKGPKKDTHDIFIDGLPGSPDNLQNDGHGGFLVALVFADDADHPGPVRILSQFPLLRRFFSRIMGLVQFGLKTANQIYAMEFFDQGIHFVGHFDPVSALSPKRVSILRISESGVILDSVHSLNSRKVRTHCEALITKDYLYLASPFNEYLVRRKLSEVGWGHLKNDREMHVIKRSQCEGMVKKTTPTPTTTTPKPTTTPSPTPKVVQTTTTAKPTTQKPQVVRTTTPKPTTAAPRSTTQVPKPVTQAPKPAKTAQKEPLPKTGSPAAKNEL